MRRSRRHRELRGEPRLYGDLYAERVRAVERLIKLVLISILWAVTCSASDRATSRPDGGGNLAPAEDLLLGFAPPVEAFRQELFPGEGVTEAPTPGRPWPNMPAPSEASTSERPAPRVTDDFGPRIHPVTGEADFHDAIDIAAPPGTPFLPLAPGVVTTVGYKGNGGLVITVRHEDGYESDYMHLRTSYVRPGQSVTRRTYLGETGRSGRVTGPHLHCRARRGRQAIPPVQLIEWAVAKYGDG